MCLACSRAARFTRQSTILFYLFYLNQYLSPSIQFRTASLNEADTKKQRHKNIKETKQQKLSCQGNMYRYYCLRWSLSLILAPLFMCEHRLF